MDGTARVLIVDISNPTAMSVAGTLDIPATLQLTGIAIQGSTALAVGSSGSWNSGQSDLGLTGHIVLTTLDVSDPRHPSIIAQQNMSRASRGLATAPISIGDGLFAVANLGPIGGQPEVIVVNASDPHNLASNEVAVPADVTALASGNGELYTTSATGLLIYDIGATPNGCAGDCDGSGAVTVNEVIILVNIALGTADASACPNGIPSGATVGIPLIVRAVNNALGAGLNGTPANRSGVKTGAASPGGRRAVAAAEVRHGVNRPPAPGPRSRPLPGCPNGTRFVPHHQ